MRAVLMTIIDVISLGILLAGGYLLVVLVGALTGAV